MGQGFEVAGDFPWPTQRSGFAGSRPWRLPLALPLNIYFAHVFSGILRKMGCRIRPYEKDRGATNTAIDKSVDPPG
jgi:hypothetical protein